MNIRFRVVTTALCAITVLFCSLTIGCKGKTNAADSVVKIQADLSNFGVESDWYPSAHCIINLANNTSICKKVYDSPKFKDSTYSLSSGDIHQIYSVLQSLDLKKLKKRYAIGETDQPKSTITFYTRNGKVVVEDYGLRGDPHLQDLYKIIYKLD